jgi:hypothetical protein
MTGATGPTLVIAEAARYIDARELPQGAVRRLACVDRDSGCGLGYSLGARQARVEGGSRHVCLTNRLSCICLQQTYLLAAGGLVSL